MAPTVDINSEILVFRVTEQSSSNTGQLLFQILCWSLDDGWHFISCRALSLVTGVLPGLWLAGDQPPLPEVTRLSSRHWVSNWGWGWVGARTEDRAPIVITVRRSQPWSQHIGQTPGHATPGNTSSQEMLILLIFLQIQFSNANHWCCSNAAHLVVSSDQWVLTPMGIRKYLSHSGLILLGCYQTYFLPNWMWSIDWYLTESCVWHCRLLQPIRAHYSQDWPMRDKVMWWQ